MRRTKSKGDPDPGWERISWDEVLDTVAENIKAMRARLTEGIAYDIVCTQNGWWQACHALGLPGYDPYSSEGANVNLLYQTDKIDPVSGSLPIKGYPCNVRKA